MTGTRQSYDGVAQINNVRSVHHGDGSRMNTLTDLAVGQASRSNHVIDQTKTLDPDFPMIIRPPKTGHCTRFPVKQRNIRGFGIETVGIDAGQDMHLSPPYPAHFILHGAGQYGLHCLANLDQIPPTGAILMAAPLKIKNGTGSPLQEQATVEKAEI